MTLSHSSVVPNQNLTISGSEFSTGGAVICEDSITIAGAAAQLSRDSADSTGTPCPAGQDFVKLSSGGAFVATVIVPATRSVLDAGNFGAQSVLKVVDTEGRSATVILTIPKRSFVVTPEESGPRSLLTISGSGFPADNAEGVPGFSANVTVTYEHDLGTRSTTATPDANGKFAVTLTAPSNAPIPSTNRIRAKVTGSDGTVATSSINHRIPAPIIRVAPASGPPGSVVTIEGEGFRNFDLVEKMAIGGRSVLGGRAINTDANGAFAADGIVVPGLDAGSYFVEALVGPAIATIPFQVTQASPAVTPTPQTPTKTPTPTPTATPAPTATPTPTPTPMPRYSLYIDGSLVQPSQMLVNVVNGFVTLSHAPASDSKYAADTEVSIAVHPDVFGATNLWKGIDGQSGSSATVTMTADRFVEVRITPPAPSPAVPGAPTLTPTFTPMSPTLTPAPAPPRPTSTPTPGAGGGGSNVRDLINDNVVVATISAIGSIIVAFLGYLGVRAARRSRN